MKPINWERIYLDNAPKLKGVCRRYVGNEAVADDLVQETFITAIEKAGSFSNKGSIEGWVYKIAINKALQYLRKQEHLIPIDGISQHPENITGMEQSRNRIRAAIEQASFSAGELISVIDKLPMHHRTVFNLYVMDGYSHQQIANELNISAGTSKSHLSRARKKAQELLYEKSQQGHMIQRRKLTWLLLLPWTNRHVDHIFKRGLKGFELATQTPAFIQNAAPFNSIKWSASLAGKAVIYGSAATLIAGTCWLVTESSMKNTTPCSTLPALVTTLPETLQSIAPDTFMVEVVEPVVEETIQEKPEEPGPAKPEPVIIKKTIVIRDTIRLEKPIE